MPRDGTKNLIPFDQRSKEEASEYGKKGGIKSGEARRRKKSLKEAANAVLAMTPSKDQAGTKLILKSMGIDENDYSYGAALVSSMIIQAIKGNTKAAKFIMDISGQNPMYQLQERQFEYEKERRSGQGTEIEDI